jgi:hypothetical protein
MSRFITDGIPVLRQECVDFVGARKTFVAGHASLSQPKLIFEFLNPVRKGVEIALRHHIRSEPVMPRNGYRLT